MANPFKEAEKAKKKAPGSKQEAPEKKEEVVKVETPVVEEKPVETITERSEAKTENKPKAKPAGESKKKEETASKPVADLFAKLETEKPAQKTYAFYLTEENADKLKKMAEQKGMSTSKLLDYILSQVL